MLNEIISTLNDALYSYILIIILVLGGLFFTFRTKFIQFRLLKEQFRAVLEKPADGNGVSSFQALMVSTASRVGTGNIIGVSTALCLGGFGSVFWMWVIAIVGSASAFIESTLAQIYKRKGPDGCYGGPAYYIEATLRCRPLAIVFSIYLLSQKEKLGRQPSSDETESIIKKAIKAVNKKIPAYKHIKIVEVLSTALEKTTTQKIKRFGKNIK